MTSGLPARPDVVWGGPSVPSPPVVPRIIGSSRLVAVDLARGLAVLGMFAAHMWPRLDLDERVFDGRSAILFATLAGVSLGLMSGGARPTPHGSRGRVVGSIAIRAGVLIALGLVLQWWNAYILIILAYYGLMFLLLLPLLFAPRWALATTAAALAVIAPWLAALVPVDVNGDPLAGGLPGLVADAFLVGAYPALVWLPFLCVGLVAVRSDLTRGRTQLTMLAAGTAAAVIGYTARFLPGAGDIAALDPAAHGGTPAEIVGSGGVAVAVIGLLLWLTSDARGGVGRALRLVGTPIAATGAQPLTVYTAHIVLTAPLFLAYRDVGGSYGLPLAYLVAAIVITLAYATAWSLFVGRGPLERFVALLSRPWTWGGSPASPRM
ncbi:hypothetical protein ACPEEZ_09145 [Frigoribacterium sp. 2-23]|uniref:hypothetical protein n=1 Tax=Frigoribacterium sp. 2-23 TaxID=3415006 RepID=UPI003C700DE2